MRRVIALVSLLLTGLWPLLGNAACPPPVAGLQPRLEFAGFAPASVPANSVGITFLGHASFLIESPQGVTIVTDWNAINRPAQVPQIVTMNNAHSTHFTNFIEPDILHVLRGWEPDGRPAFRNLSERDVHIRNVVTNRRDFAGGTVRNGNSIFVFEIGDLCIAHLSHLHHLLTPDHLRELGQIDVLLLPVDGAYTLSQDDSVEVMKEIAAPLVIPMHYFDTSILNRFLTKVRGDYPVRISSTAGTVLRRSDLPRKPEILVLPGGF